MAVVSAINQAAWNEWVATRPQVVQELCHRLPPDRLYRMKSSGHRVTLYSYREDGTVTVVVSGKFNLVVFERLVFWISPDDLEECDLPGPDEKVGTALTNREDIDAFVKNAKISETAKKN